MTAGTLEITYTGTATTDEKNELVRDLPEIELGDDDQGWFWTKEWQDSIQRSVRQIKSGEGTTFTSTDAFMGELDED